MILWVGRHMSCARHYDPAGRLHDCAPSIFKVLGMPYEPHKSDLATLSLSTPLAANVCTKADAACIVLQAHSDALGSWGDNGAAARRAWEGDGRIDLRSVTNCLRQLPYHVAWQKGFRQAAGVLNPTVPIDSALETCRELGEGQHTSITCQLCQLLIIPHVPPVLKQLCQLCCRLWPTEAGCAGGLLPAARPAGVAEGIQGRH